MFSGTAKFSHQACQVFFFFAEVSSVCLPVHLTMVDKNKAVICALLATSAIMLSEKKKRKCKMWSKLWSKKWYWERNVSCDCALFFINFWKVEYLEMMPSWCRQVNWGNCWIPWINCAVLCMKDDWKIQFCVLRCYHPAIYSLSCRVKDIVLLRTNNRLFYCFFSFCFLSVLWFSCSGFHFIESALLTLA
jgi:hypothetical protein